MGLRGRSDGAKGVDTIFGYGGNDTLSGGDGNDVIEDFAANDKLWLEAFGLGSVAETLGLGRDVGDDCVFAFDACQVTVLDWNLGDFTAGNVVL